LKDAQISIKAATTKRVTIQNYTDVVAITLGTATTTAAATRVDVITTSLSPLSPLSPTFHHNMKCPEM
tara:strand:+ start:170 stop:373 length:204 start_codon:yes stop_codon:yes gene_type:complete